MSLKHEIMDFDLGVQLTANKWRAGVEFWYPRTEGHIDHVQVGLMDIRAADDIRIRYDFERDGWSIMQASVFEWEADDKELDSDWQEVAFVQAWGRRDAGGSDNRSDE